MTTVYVDRRAGIVLTDSRVTRTEKRSLFDFIPLSTKEDFGVVNQKALYVHDRIFTGAGSVNEINKILNFLISGKPVVPSTEQDESCQCLLIGKEYAIHLVIHKGKFHKWVEFYKDEYWSFATGSGSPHISGAGSMGLAIITKDKSELCGMIIERFMRVKNLDKYSDDNINLYRF